MILFCLAKHQYSKIMTACRNLLEKATSKESTTVNGGGGPKKIDKNASHLAEMALLYPTSCF